MQRDILVPFFSHSYGDIINTPWESKTPKALMRAAAQVQSFAPFGACHQMCPEVSLRKQLCVCHQASCQGLLGGLSATCVLLCAFKAKPDFCMQNGMDRNCTRLWLLELAKIPLGQKLLDVGITNNLKKGLKVELVSRRALG